MACAQVEDAVIIFLIAELLLTGQGALLICFHGGRIREVREIQSGRMATFDVLLVLLTHRVGSPLLVLRCTLAFE